MPKININQNVFDLLLTIKSPNVSWSSFLLEWYDFISQFHRDGIQSELMPSTIISPAVVTALKSNANFKLRQISLQDTIFNSDLVINSTSGELSSNLLDTSDVPVKVTLVNDGFEDLS